MRFSRWLFLGLTLALIRSLSLLAGDRLPGPELETLPNGLRVAWFVDSKLPILDLAMLVRSGTRDDPHGKSGAAELTARLLERGSGGMSPLLYARKVEELGASAYSDADEDAIAIGIHGLSQDSDRLLDLFSSLVLRPDFVPAEFERARALMVESWNQLGNSADALADFVFTRTLMNGSSYGRGSVLGPQEVSRLGLDDIKGFYSRHFVPENAVLAVVGRVDREKFRALLLKHFGQWSGKAPAHVYRKYRDSRFGAKQSTIWVIDRPDVPQAQIRIGFPVPGVQSPKRYALAVANALTGEYFASRLNSVIRDELGLAYGVGSNLNYSRDQAFMTISSATRAESTGKLLSVALGILGSIRRGGISESEVKTARDYLTGSFPLSVSTLGAVATRWLSGYLYDLGPEFLNEYLPRIRSVTHREVVDAVDEGFQLDQRVVVVAGDSSKIMTSLIASGFKDVRKLDSKIYLKR